MGKNLAKSRERLKPTSWRREGGLEIAQRLRVARSEGRDGPPSLTTLEETDRVVGRALPPYRTSELRSASCTRRRGAAAFVC